MKSVYKLLLLAMIACLTFAVSSCGNDEKDEPSGSKSTSLVINGQKAGKIYNAQCTTRGWSEEMGGGNSVSFDLMFEYDDEMTTFSISWPFKRSSLKKGMDLLDRDEPEDVTFRGTMQMEIDPRYENFGGEVIVQSISNDKIALKFVDFSFTKSSGNRAYIINGTVTYDLL
ncbi:MAG: hypothetical protein K2N10_03875 [Muribaculaceae bacterium]|nr:hypothetical protein [Muribaculaceae bacterium]